MPKSIDQHLSFRSFHYISELLKRISKIIVSLVHFIITLSDVSVNEYFIGYTQKFDKIWIWRDIMINDIMLVLSH